MIENEIVKKKYKNQLIMLIVGVILAAITVALVFLKDYVIRKTSIHFADAYVNETLDEVDFVYVNLTDYLYEFCYYDGYDRYCFGFDEYDNIYIIRCDLPDEEAINKEIDEKGIAYVAGTVSKLDEEVLDSALEYLNDSRPDEEGEITQEDFDLYFQGVGLWVNNITGFVVGIAVLAALTGFIAMGLVLFGTIGLVSFKIGLKGLTELDRYHITCELSDPETEYIKECGIFLTPSYLVCVGGGFEAIPYEKMNWAYEYKQSYNGLLVQDCIIIWIKGGKKKAVGGMSLIIRNRDEVVYRVFDGIYRHNPNVQFGYTEELKKQFGKKKSWFKRK
ncbi:MAG: hypothetical protein K6D96_04510 [Acetatifactor sp.]|nr:hypothetical protein [Acetatifactor sp.]